MKRLLLIGLLMGLLALTGCTSVTALSDDEENMIAEYMAKELLESQKEYTKVLYTPSPIPSATPTPRPKATLPPTTSATPTTVVSDSSSGKDLDSASTQQANADFAQVMGMTDIKVEYTGYEILDSITEDVLSLSASKGKVLYMIKFNVTNNSDQDMQFQLRDLDISYRLDLNNKQKVKPLITLKDNDLRFIDLKLKANKTLETVVMFEVNQNIKMEHANLIISRDDKTAIIKLK